LFVRQDYYGQQNGAPVADAINDIELISAEETATHTTVVFRRALNTGDTFDDLPFEVQKLLGKT